MTYAGRLRDGWQRATTRERALLVLGTLVVVATAGYALVWQPVARDLRSGAHGLAEARAQWTRVQRMVDEIPGLAREARPPRNADPRAAVEQAVATSGLRGELTALDVQDGRVRVTFAAVEFAALAAMLDRLGREEQLFPVEALLAPRVAAGTVRAEITLAGPQRR